jgi:hypothetical protein
LLGVEKLKVGSVDDSEGRSEMECQAAGMWKEGIATATNALKRTMKKGCGRRGLRDRWASYTTERKRSEDVRVVVVGQRACSGVLR